MEILKSAIVKILLNVGWTATIQAIMIMHVFLFFTFKKKHFIMIETLKEIPLVGMLMYPGIMSTLNDPTIAMILGAYNISLKMIHSYSDYSGCYNNNMDRYWCNIWIHNDYIHL